MGEGCTVVLGGVKVKVKVACWDWDRELLTRRTLGLVTYDVPWALGVYRGPPEVYRGPCMKITPWNCQLYPTNMSTIPENLVKIGLVFSEICLRQAIVKKEKKKESNRSIT